jgi:hypothetical protein
MDAEALFRRGPCMRRNCPGQVCFDVGGTTHHLPGQPEMESKSCHVCGLVHDREVASGLVSARWADGDKRPAADEGYYLR